MISAEEAVAGAGDSQNEAVGPPFVRRIMGIETEYGLTCSGPAQRRRLSPDEVARLMFRPVVERYGSSNVFTDNASRLYLDVGNHPEIATAECDSLTQLLRYERAGDLAVDALAQQAERALVEQGSPSNVYLFKNNVDSVGNSYGCHENYLISRSVVLKDLSTALMPFLITRQLICGAGMVTRAQGESPASFVLSQRADQVWESISSATTRSRPIINTRDEPHGDSKRFRRLHIIVGDSNMSEPSFALKVGSTLMMLEMLEAGVGFEDVALVDPIKHIRAVAADLTGGTELPLERGGSITALRLQQILCDKATEWLARREENPGATSTAELRRVVDLWQRTLDAIGAQDFSQVDTEIDWVIKKKLLGRFQQRLGCGWDHPKIAQLDLAYHDIRPSRGVYDALLRQGAVSRWCEDLDLAECLAHPPQSTRALLRGQFLSAARELQANVTVDWTRMKLNRPEPRTVECLDPFAARDERIAELIEAMRTHSESARATAQKEG